MTPKEISTTFSMLLRPSLSQRTLNTDQRAVKTAPSMSADWDTVIGRQEQTYKVDMWNTVVPLTGFLTGSSYEGDWDILGMSGFGTYTFPHGVVYEGYFRDGEFHGEGTLTYPMGQKVHGMWSGGDMLSWSYQFQGGLEFDAKWNYCKYPDRRFHSSIKSGLNPAGMENLTNDTIPRKIPDGCYDAGDGFYQMKNRCIISVNDEKKILRIPREAEAEWIVKNCRKAWDEPTGYNPDLYPDWTTGMECEEGSTEGKRKKTRSSTNVLFRRSRGKLPSVHLN